MLNRSSEMTKELRHVMIDLETMGTTPNSAIVSIGAVPFDPRQGKVSNQTFYRELDWEDQGRYICPKTTEWWKGQSDEAKAAHFGLDSLKNALNELAAWLPKDAKVWGNGATFDVSMLEDAYRQYYIEIPWKFWNVRDCRTVLDMYESVRGGFNKTVNGQVAHNALDDAKFQAQYIAMMWSRLTNVA
jgi:exodeoxyribonuclease VIII